MQYIVTPTSTSGLCVGSPYTITVTVNPIPSKPTVISPLTYCQNDTASQLTATGTNLLWHTTYTGGTWSLTAPTPSTTNAGQTNYYVSQSVKGCEGDRALILVIINALPATPIISQNGNDLISNTDSGNQWYDDNGIIAGATSLAYTPHKNGNYYVIVTQNGCESLPSNVITFIWTGIQEFKVQGSKFRVQYFPNPNDGNFFLEINGTTGESYTLKIRNLLGEELLDKKFQISSSKFQENINVSKLANGIYQISLFNENNSFKGIVVIQK